MISFIKLLAAKFSVFLNISNALDTPDSTRAEIAQT
jgi:hypothetical protein